MQHRALVHFQFIFNLFLIERRMDETIVSFGVFDRDPGYSYNYTHHLRRKSKSHAWTEKIPVHTHKWVRVIINCISSADSVADILKSFTHITCLSIRTFIYDVQFMRLFPGIRSLHIKNPNVFGTILKFVKDYQDNCALRQSMVLLISSRTFCVH